MQPHSQNDKSESVIVEKLLKSIDQRPTTEQKWEPVPPATPTGDELKDGRIPAGAEFAFQTQNERMFVECIHPLVEAKTPEDFMQLAASKARIFGQMLLVRQAFALMIGPEKKSRPLTNLNRQRLIDAAKAIGGEEAANEADFISKTMENAVRTAARFRDLPLAVERAEDDYREAASYLASIILHRFSAAILFELVRRSLNVEWLTRCTMGFLRESAFLTFHHAQCGLRLRKQHAEVDPTPLGPEGMELALLDS